MAQVFPNLARGQVEAVCYSDRVVKDDLSRRLEAAVVQWREVRGLSDEQLAEQIKADGIDILIDLAGHTANNRLLVFGRKPAPIQITWAGYVGTTGLSAIDYIIVDRQLVPTGSEQDYCERILRLPAGHVCYEAPEFAPPVGPLPAVAEGRVTFGCFNNPAKIDRTAIGVWSRILRRVPQARLVLKYKGMNDRANAERLRAGFAAEQIEATRVELWGHSGHAEALAAYHQIDLALDPFTFSGALTTCDALWMGVPVVTCPGERFASRQSYSLLHTVGLTATLARDREDYVEKAVGLAADLPRLAQLRAGLRAQMAASPLCDGRTFTHHFSQLLQQVWLARFQDSSGTSAAVAD
jgi:predicted O-linked N-acetylglucosamine transferase (SPINDLY family)